MSRAGEVPARLDVLSTSASRENGHNLSVEPPQPSGSRHVVGMPSRLENVIVKYYKSACDRRQAKSRHMGDPSFLL
jgi:hypothetical protein